MTLAQVLTFLVLLLVVPFILIYFVNTMFDVSNPFDLEHWFAASLWLGTATGVMKFVGALKQ